MYFQLIWFAEKRYMYLETPNIGGIELEDILNIQYCTVTSQNKLVYCYKSGYDLDNVLFGSLLNFIIY